MTDKRIRSALVGTPLALLISLLATAPAGADTFKPTRLDDPTPNGCKPNNCSLREAVAAANGHPGRDEISLQEGTYDLELPGDVNGGDLPLVTSIELRGKGARKTKIDANGIDRVISMGCGASAIGAVTIKRVTLTGGDPGANEFNCFGPGMASIGGGILIFENKLTLAAVTIRGNTADFGGGLTSRGASELTIRNSTIRQNDALEGGGLDLRSDDPQPVTVIRSSTISGNTASKGAGILADGLPDNGEVPEVTLTNSTVAGNMANNEGGGIMADNAAEVTLDNTTVAYNQGNFDDVGVAEGGGVYQHSGAVFGLDDTLVAANLVGQGGDGPQCAGDFSVAKVIVQSQAGVACDFSGSFSSVADAVIGPLAKNGGPTRTVALQDGSPAIDNGAVNCPKKDQRGEDRPANDGKCDAGAFERQPNDP